jgi:hypothetical protein
MTNKQEWAKLKDVDYIRVETRPPRRDFNANTRCQLTLDWLPAGDSGACDAFQALLKASLCQKTPEQSKAFYEALREFAEKWY